MVLKQGFTVLWFLLSKVEQSITQKYILTSSSFGFPASLWLCGYGRLVVRSLPRLFFMRTVYIQREALLTPLLLYLILVLLSKTFQKSDKNNKKVHGFRLEGIQWSCTKSKIIYFLTVSKTYSKSFRKCVWHPFL